MRAAVRTNYGPPDVVRIAEVDKPTPKDDQVLVKVAETFEKEVELRGAPCRGSPAPSPP